MKESYTVKELISKKNRECYQRRKKKKKIAEVAERLSKINLEQPIYKFDFRR